LGLRVVYQTRNFNRCYAQGQIDFRPPVSSPPEIQEPLIRAVVAAVQLPGVSDLDLQASITELRELALTLGYLVVGTFVQKRDSFDTTAYMGTGKRTEMRQFIEHGDTAGMISEDIAALARAPKSGAARAKQAAQSEANAETRFADLLIVDHEISPSQARNLEIEVGCQVLDRTMVILEIFHRHASSRAAKAQVEIARLGYLAPRLREAAKLAGPKGRQRSGVGGRGAGEAHSELDRQKIRNRIAELQQEIKVMDLERKTQRARRQEGLSLARVVLVGYTNAGKSTLMHALTGSDSYVANKLFATLDTTVRALHPQSIPRILVSDTVGFIKNLPHDLVASFKSTLEEAAEASLLLHVIDANDSSFARQIQVTESVLADIGATEVPRLLIFNKLDLAGDSVAQEQRRFQLRAQFPDCLVLSALDRHAVNQLHIAIVGFFQNRMVRAKIVLPWSEQHLRADIFAHCKVLAETALDNGAELSILGPKELVKSLVKQFKEKPRKG
jgi:GTPase